MKTKKSKTKFVNPDDLTIDQITAACHKLGIRVHFDMKPTSFQKFYMIFVEGKESPKVMIDRHENAFAEATRLAAKEGRKAYILQAVLCAEPETKMHYLEAKDLNVNKSS